MTQRVMISQKMVNAFVQYLKVQLEKPQLPEDEFKALATVKKCLEVAYKIKENSSELRVFANIEDIFKQYLLFSNISHEKKLEFMMKQYLTEELNRMSENDSKYLVYAINILQTTYNIEECSGHTKQTSSLIEEIFKQHLFASAKEDEKNLKIGTVLSLIQAAKDLVGSRNFGEAECLFTQAINLHPESAPLYFSRAIVLQELGNLVGSIEDCKTALKLDPSLTMAYIKQGLSYYSLEMFPEAIQQFEKALEIEPENESFQHHLSVAQIAIAAAKNENDDY